MKSWIAKHKNEVIVSIISSLIVTLFFKAGDIILAFAPHTSGKIYDLLNNKIYYFAANQSAVSLFGNTFLIIICVFTVFSLGLVIRTVSIIHEYDVSRALKEELKKGDGQNIQKVEKLKKKFARLTSKGSILKSNRKIIIVIVLFVLITIWCVFAMYTFLFIPVKLWNDFQLDVTQITPYCERKEVEALQSEWVSMGNKSDYESIYNTIAFIRDSNELPKLIH